MCVLSIKVHIRKENKWMKRRQSKIQFERDRKKEVKRKKQRRCADKFNNSTKKKKRECTKLNNGFNPNTTKGGNSNKIHE